MIFKKKEAKQPKITNKTIEKNRKKILASGRKFKYPIQYEKHKLVINAILVGVVLMLSLSAYVYWQLYRVYSDSYFAYRITRFIPLPVAKIDGESALYSDYLGQYRSSMHYYQNKEIDQTPDKESQQRLSKNFKEKALDNAIKIAYARKLAKELNITVTEKEKADDLDMKLSLGSTKISIQAFNNTAKGYYGLNPAEYQRVFIENPILLQKVSLAIDQQARDITEKVTTSLKADSDLKKISEQYSKYGVEYFDSGLVNQNNSDSGRVKKALGLKINQVSEPFIPFSMDGYYFVKLIYKDNENVRYQVLKVPLKEFDKRLNAVKEAGKIKKFIEI